jgi:hypothetical protein
VKVAVSVVELTTFTALTVTPVPLTDTAAPARKFVPVRVTGTTSPCNPEGILIDESVGAAEPTENVTTPLVPPELETVTFRVPATAVELIVNVVVIDVEFTTVTGPTVTSALLVETVEPAVKFVPVSVTPTTVPCRPDAGLIDDSVGAAAPTENVTAPLVPPELETVTFRAPTTAVELIVNVVVIDVEFTTVTGPTVTSALLVETVEPAIKFVPVSVTPTTAPCMPDAGLIDDSVGTAEPEPTENVTAPLVPPELETVTFRVPCAAVELIVKVVVIDVEFTTVTGPTVTSMLLIETVEPATKFVPVSVTPTTAP